MTRYSHLICHTYTNNFKTNEKHTQIIKQMKIHTNNKTRTNVPGHSLVGGHSSVGRVIR